MKLNNWSKFFIAIVIVAGLVLIPLGIYHYFYKAPPGPAKNLDELEPIVMSVTASLGSFLIATTEPASRTIEAFSLHTLSTKPRLSYVFASYTCDIRSQGRQGIFILRDKDTGALLFEDGTWPASISLDAPHWRIPNLPRLEFPVPEAGK